MPHLRRSSFFVVTVMLSVWLISISATAQPSGTQNSSATQEWRELTKAPDFFQEMSLLESLGQNLSERPAVLKRLHSMWATYDVLRQPAIAYLMCQLGDRSGVESVAKAFFAGDYDTGRELDPDGAAAGANATDAALRLVILYGTRQERLRLATFFKLSEDPLSKRADLCGALLGLSSMEHGPGLPREYPKEKFPLDLAVACLDYTEEVDTIVSAPGGRVVSHVDSNQGSITVDGATGSYTVRGCDEGAQTIQNLSGRDFGHHLNDPVSQRNRAIRSIKEWWVASHIQRSQ
jgi:hypothetical protein